MSQLRPLKTQPRNLRSIREICGTIINSLCVNPFNLRESASPKNSICENASNLRPLKIPSSKICLICVYPRPLKNPREDSAGGFLVVGVFFSELSDEFFLFED